jgi:putative ATP-binding cassette transporter
MPRTPYLPPGSLREVLAYPFAASKFTDEDFKSALSKFGLEALSGSLDAVKRWDHDFNEDEQQAFAFARVLLHRPPWLLIDEVLDGMDDENLARVAHIFREELPKTAVIHIGRSTSYDEIFNRVLHLVKDPELHRLPVMNPQTA